jgi:hypothetical protein
MTPTDGNTGYLVRSMPVGRTPINQILLNAGRTKLSLAMGGLFSAGHPYHPVITQRTYVVLRTLLNPKKRPVSRKSGIATDQLCEIALRLPRQSVGEPLDLLGYDATNARVSMRTNRGRFLSRFYSTDSDSG